MGDEYKLHLFVFLLGLGIEPMALCMPRTALRRDTPLHLKICLLSLGIKCLKVTHTAAEEQFFLLLAGAPLQVGKVVSRSPA